MDILGPNQKKGVAGIGVEVTFPNLCSARRLTHRSRSCSRRPSSLARMARSTRLKKPSHRSGQAKGQIPAAERRRQIQHRPERIAAALIAAPLQFAAICRPRP